MYNNKLSTKKNFVLYNKKDMANRITFGGEKYGRIMKKHRKLVDSNIC
jgi:hypothetical protein